MGQLGKSLMVLWSEQVKPFSHKQIVQPQIFIIPSHFPWWIVSLIQKNQAPPCYLPDVASFFSPPMVASRPLLQSHRPCIWLFHHSSSASDDSLTFFLSKSNQGQPTGSDLISPFVKLWRSLTFVVKFVGMHIHLWMGQPVTSRSWIESVLYWCSAGTRRARWKIKWSDRYCAHTITSCHGFWI